MPRRPIKPTRIRSRMLSSWISRCRVVVVSTRSSISAGSTRKRAFSSSRCTAGLRHALQAFRAGAKGYVTKSSPPDFLVSAVRSVAEGRVAICPEISEVLALDRVQEESTGVGGPVAARVRDLAHDPRGTSRVLTGPTGARDSTQMRGLTSTAQILGRLPVRLGPTGRAQQGGQMPGHTQHISVCPHDCPSVCALEIERIVDHPGDRGRLGKVRGSERNPYTAGVICAKVARYAERFHHPDRLARPLRRAGAKGSGTSRRSPGTMRSTRSPRRLPARASATAARRCGPTTTPARWASCSATASTACATSCATPAGTRRSASCSPTSAGRRATASAGACPARRWRTPT